MRRTTMTLAAASVLALGLAGTVQAASGTLDLGPPWGGADQTATDRVEVSYTIKANGKIPASAVSAVEDGIAAWNAAIDAREASWDFDIVALANATTNSSAGGPPAFHHRPGHGGGPPGGGGGGGGGGGEPDVEIQLKKGGGVIAGSAQRTLDANGFVVHVKVQISGSAFGLENDPATIQEVTEHELGHGLALGHHANEADLMGQTVGYEGGGPSACDLDGFERAHSWLTDDLGVNGPYRVADQSINC